MKRKKKRRFQRWGFPILNKPILENNRNLTSRETKGLRSFGVSVGSKSKIWLIVQKDPDGISGFLYRKGNPQYIKVKMKRGKILEFFPAASKHFKPVRRFKEIPPEQNYNLPKWLQKPEEGRIKQFKRRK